ncbi:gamma-glutamylcyclotransferase-like [Lucilia sericata]|uniref:gamma-glutamylcyclotransferase-like n=1 Tax=Lucilia sericata TaxID=13632 RepID=UPI0018A8231F|nr:gamma-glutamylcyclotransferase-like [Lucilia sericata]
MVHNIPMVPKFYYFGYGSNMLAKRIHIQNPGAQRVGVGKLQDYRLDFHTSSSNWLGAPATIVPSLGDVVYGAIWEIDSCHIKDLDNQEGVHDNLYKPLTLPVYCLNLDKNIECRSYHLVNQPSTHLKTLTADTIPANRQPSKTYLKTLLKGALETGLPADYIQWLKTVHHNSTIVEKFEKHLELDKVDL